MKKLPKFTLTLNEKRATWDLVNDKTNKTLKHFQKKEKATTGGVLRKAVGKEGGSVKIQDRDGKFQEERTYPKSKDPKSSKG